MKTSEIKELTIKEIIEKIETDRDELVRLKLNHSISPLENPVKIKNLRRDIARMQTILQQKQSSEK